MCIRECVTRLLWLYDSCTVGCMPRYAVGLKLSGNMPIFLAMPWLWLLSARGARRMICLPGSLSATVRRWSSSSSAEMALEGWKYTGDLRTEMENAITVSLGEGVSASTMSRRVRRYLQEPERLYRRVRGADGKLHLSKAAKAYHPGQGVYRSSYKNAMRLTRTETNAAYRLTDEDRWQGMDFVVGMRVHKSNNHPTEDICDVLAGDYPKDFKFSAWHPQCRCYVTAILCTKEEMIRMQRKILAGNDAANEGFRSVNEVRTVPKAFKDWVENNQDRIVRAKALPYFLRDNGKIVDGKYFISIAGNREKSIDGGSPSLIFARAEMRRKVETNLKLLKGEPMSITDADKQNANPHVLKGLEYQTNCSATSAAFIMRLWGYNITAAPCVEGSRVYVFLSVMITGTIYGKILMEAVPKSRLLLNG